MEVDIEIFDMKIGRLLMGFRQVANFLVEKKNYVYVSREAAHGDYLNGTWVHYKVNEDHPNHGIQRLRSVIKYAAKHIKK